MTYAQPVNYPPLCPWGTYPSGKIHKAIDYLSPTGSRVQSAASGTVTTAGWSTTGFGNHVRVKFDDGYTGIYGHLSRIDVKVGQRVAKRQQIGLSGSSGNATGPHLHFEVRGSSWVPLTAVNYTSKLEPYTAPPAPTPTKSPTNGESATYFNRSLLKYGANNAEVKKFQAWLWWKQTPAFRTWFAGAQYNFTSKGFSTYYGDATARLVQETYKNILKSHPNEGWDQGWVNGVPPREPGPAFIRFFGGTTN